MTATTAIRERPILFSGPMVRAILDGSKTQTRRVLREQPSGDDLRICEEAYDWTFGDDMRAWGLTAGDHGFEETTLKNPYGHPLYENGCGGDRLWVRETHHETSAGAIIYRADYPDNAKARGFENIPVEADVTWRPSIFLRREHARITLEITDVRVQRVQEISEADAIAEGWQKRPDVSADPEVHRDAARDWYADLWQELNAPRGYGWHTNPWVWALTFRWIEP